MFLQATRSSPFGDLSASRFARYLISTPPSRPAFYAQIVANASRRHRAFATARPSNPHALAIAAALRANTVIKSLNIGDNWFCDEGVHAIAQAQS